MMTVLQVCAFAAPTAGNFIPALLKLENRLKENNVNTIYAFPERAKDKDWCIKIQQYAKVYFLPEANARIKYETYKIFKRIYKENKIDIVHSHFELYDIPSTMMAPKGVKIFWHLHDAIKELYEKADRKHRILYKLQYGFCGKKARMLTVSQKHADFVIDLGFSAKSVHYIPNGIDLDRIEKNGFATSQKDFLMFGWEVYRKGVDILVEAAKEIEVPFKVMLVGHDVCKEYLNEVSAPDSIVYTEPVKNINELYSKSYAFLHISRAEGLSYALLEAIYYGLPIICSDIPENMFAKEFKNVFWMKTGDYHSLKSVILELLNNRNVVKAQDVEYNRSIIEKMYSMDVWVDNILSYYFPN